MRRSSSQDRSSFGPLRVKHDENAKASSSKNSRNSACGTSRQSKGGRSVSGNRMSAGGRPSISTSRKSVQSTNRFGQQNRLSRGSGMGSRGNGSAKDVLPISNKSFQQKCMQNVLQFLTERGYPHHLTPKILQSPTAKDFYKVFEFIYGFISPNYKVPQTRPEEEIPRILKMMGYPTTISRSSMFAIGSPHTWPTILAALSFLVEAISYGFTIADHGDELLYTYTSEDDVFGGASDEQLFFKYLEQAYTSFLEGSDTFEEEDGDLKSALTRRAQADEGSIESILQEITALENQMELLETDTDRLKNAREKLEIMQHDEERFVSYINELESHRKNLGQEIADAEVDCANLAQDLEAENATVLKMQLIYESQEFTQADVERIHLKRRELTRQRDDVESSCQAVDEEIWREEVAMTKEMEQMESKCQQYNKLAYGLKLIPVTAENSCGVDYEMKKPSMGDSAESWDFHSKIKPALYALKSQVAESTNMKESEKIKLSEKLEQVTDCWSDVQNEVSLMESKYKRAEDEFEAKKRLYQTEMQKAQEQVEELQNEMVHLNRGMFLSENEASKERKQITQWAAKEKENSQREVQKFMAFFEKAMQMFMDHMEALQGVISGIAERTEREKIETFRKAGV